MSKKNYFVLKKAEQVRKDLTRNRLKNIRKMYVEMYKETERKINAIPENNMKKQDLLIFKKTIENQLNKINEELETGIKNDMNSVCEAVVEDKKEYLVKNGFKPETVKDAFVYVPQSIVRSIANGDIYQKGWTLSSSIWGNSKKVQNNINKIISIGTAQGKSAYQIAKDIEQYVLPNATKSSKTISSWRYNNKGEKVRDIFRFGKVDYNAQRLARTLVSHAYQQSFQEVNRLDPFVIGYKWETSNFHGRVCPICKARAEENRYNLGAGVFPKDELPLDHPNGMCTFTAVMEDEEEIKNKLKEWYKSPEGTFKDIDKYAETFKK